MKRSSSRLLFVLGLSIPGLGLGVGTWLDEGAAGPDSLAGALRPNTRDTDGDSAQLRETRRDSSTPSNPYRRELVEEDVHGSPEDSDPPKTLELAPLTGKEDAQLSDEELATVSEDRRSKWPPPAPALNLSPTTSPSPTYIRSPAPLHHPHLARCPF